MELMNLSPGEAQLVGQNSPLKPQLPGHLLDRLQVDHSILENTIGSKCGGGGLKLRDRNLKLFKRLFFVAKSFATVCQRQKLSEGYICDD